MIVISDMYYASKLRRQCTILFCDQHQPSHSAVDISFVVQTPEVITEPVTKAPITLHSDGHAITVETLRHIALQLGSEWRRLAQQLAVRRVRLQAILRNNQEQEGGPDSRYDMLLTWAKSLPTSVNKVECADESNWHSVYRQVRQPAVAMLWLDWIQLLCRRLNFNGRHNMTIMLCSSFALGWPRWRHFYVTLYNMNCTMCIV